MVKILKRTTDNKYLQSLENDVWVDDIKQAYIMSYKECDSVIESLLVSYSLEQIKEIVDFSRSKSKSKEESKELKSLLKK